MSEPEFLKAPQFKPTSKSWVEFYQHCEIDPAATAAAGHKVYRDVDFALMCSKGGTRKIPVKATEAHKRQFPQAWEAYQNRRELQKTHLSLLGLRPSEVMDLERFNIMCVEDLAKAQAPEPYEKYKQVAMAIIALRNQNDEQFARVRQSGGGQHIYQERQEVRSDQDQQHIHDHQTGQKAAKEENAQEKGIQVGSLTYDFSF